MSLPCAALQSVEDNVLPIDVTLAPFALHTQVSNGLSSMDVNNQMCVALSVVRTLILKDRMPKLKRTMNADKPRGRLFIR